MELAEAVTETKKQENWRAQVLQYPKVKQFIDSVSRKSVKTGENYLNAILQFKRYLDKELPEFTVDTIIEELKTERKDVYHVLDAFVSYLMEVSKVKANSVAVYMAGVRSYLQYYRVPIISAQFKHSVRLPSARQEDEYPLDAKEARQILLTITSRKLKAYCLVLASGGPRAVEALAIRLKDIDFSRSPTAIYMQAKYSKNKLPRTIYISDEATKALQTWLDFRYRNKERNPDDFIFSTWQKQFDPDKNHSSVAGYFTKFLKVAKLDGRKDGQTRHKITLHSFRRLVETVIEDNTSANYADYILGHKKSSYYTHKEEDRRQIYLEKCMKYLTFLDYSALENQGRGIEAKIKEKDVQIRDISTNYENRIVRLERMILALKSHIDDDLDPIVKSAIEDSPQELEKLKPTHIPVQERAQRHGE